MKFTCSVRLTVLLASVFPFLSRSYWSLVFSSAILICFCWVMHVWVIMHIVHWCVYLVLWTRMFCVDVVMLHIHLFIHSIHSHFYSFSSFPFCPLSLSLFLCVRACMRACVRPCVCVKVRERDRQRMVPCDLLLICSRELWLNLSKRKFSLSGDVIRLHWSQVYCVNREAVQYVFKYLLLGRSGLQHRSWWRDRERQRRRSDNRKYLDQSHILINLSDRLETVPFKSCSHTKKGKKK